MRDLGVDEPITDVVLVGRDTHCKSVASPVDRRQALAHTGQQLPLVLRVRTRLPGNGRPAERTIGVEDDQPYARDELGGSRHTGTHVPVAHDWPAIRSLESSRRSTSAYRSDAARMRPASPLVPNAPAASVV